MDKIDWSKAPKWAGAVVADNSGKLFYVEQWGGVSKKRQLLGYHEEDGSPAHMMGMHSWELIEERPAEPWTGKDGSLPPVGVECEQAPRGVAEHAREVLWRKVRIIAHVEDSRLTAGVAIYLPTDGPANCDQAVAACFRPIRTAEQIAAEERDKAIFEMAGHSHFGHSGFAMDLCAALYDAGYRKQEQS